VLFIEQISLLLCLHYIVVILASLVAAWFMQCDDKFRIYQTNNFPHDVFRAIIKVHIAERFSKTYCVALVVHWLVCWPLNPKVSSLNPAKAMDF
jgi:hypothetical protein